MQSHMSNNYGSSWCFLAGAKESSPGGPARKHQGWETEPAVLCVFIMIPRSLVTTRGGRNNCGLKRHGRANRRGGGRQIHHAGCEATYRRRSLVSPCGETPGGRSCDL
eukprot:gene6553-biopygen13731